MALCCTVLFCFFERFLGLEEWKGDERGVWRVGFGTNTNLFRGPGGVLSTPGLTFSVKVTGQLIAL